MIVIHVAAGVTSVVTVQTLHIKVVSAENQEVAVAATAVLIHVQGADLVSQ